jgi:hypothetical protein
MRLLAQILLAIWFSGNLLGAFAQNVTVPGSGFAIVTPVSGNVAGLIATETLRNGTNPDLDQTIVGPSALITTASVLVTVGSIPGNTTGIAIANPSTGTGGINLVLTEPAGNVVLDTTLSLAPRQQLSRFINEFFQTQPVEFDTPLLLTVSSEIPLALLVLDFRGGDVTSVPVNSLSFPTPVPVQPLTLAPTNAITTASANAMTTSPVMPAVPIIVTAPNNPTTTLSATPAPPAIGGNGSLVFAQVASGNGWATGITIGNTSSGSQVVRIDFFDSNGVNAGSLTDIVIQPRGVFSFSSDSTPGAVQ